MAAHGIAPLPLLDVSYSQSETVFGATTRYGRMDNDRRGGDLYIIEHAPSITWDAAQVERGLVVMMDLDAGGRTSADGATPGMLGPYVLGLWTDCAGGSIRNCRQMVPYRPPDVRQGTNRIAFLLFRQPAATWVRGISMRPFVFDMLNYLSANYPPGSSPAVSYNFFYLSGSMEEVSLDPKRQPPWNDPPPPAPPRPPPSPPPGPNPPAQTWWGGTETKRPWEHRLAERDYRL